MNHTNQLVQAKFSDFVMDACQGVHRGLSIILFFEQGYLELSALTYDLSAAEMTMIAHGLIHCHKPYAYSFIADSQPKDTPKSEAESAIMGIIIWRSGEEHILKQAYRLVGDVIELQGPVVEKSRSGVKGLMTQLFEKPFEPPEGGAGRFISVMLNVFMEKGLKPYTPIPESGVLASATHQKQSDKRVLH